MSAVETKRLRAVPDSGQVVLRSVEIALRRENTDAWDLADAVYEDVLTLLPEDKKLVVATTSSGGVGGTGIKEAEEKVYEAHSRAGTEVGPTYLRTMFDTVRVWPEPERLPDLASFVVHSELRGKDYPNRREVIQRLASKSKNGRANWIDLRRWKSERKPQPHKSFLQLAEERIRRAVTEAGKPWHTVAEEDRWAIARMMREIANEVEAGTFGRAQEDEL